MVASPSRVALERNTNWVASALRVATPSEIQRSRRCQHVFPIHVSFSAVCCQAAFLHAPASLEIPSLRACSRLSETILTRGRQGNPPSRRWFFTSINKMEAQPEMWMRRSIHCTRGPNETTLSHELCSCSCSRQM